MSDSKRETPVPSPDLFNAGAKGVMGSRLAGCPPASWHRDLAVILNRLLWNATVLTEHLLAEDDEKGNEILDTITQYCKRIYDEGKKDTAALSGMGELFDYVQSQGRQGARIWGEFCGFFLVSVYAFLFGSRTMCVQAPKQLELPDITYAMVLGMLSALPDRKRKRFLKDFRNAVVLPPGYDFSGMMQASRNYIQEIRKNQDDRRSK